MSVAVLFWILMLLWLLYGVWTSWPDWRPAGGNILLWVIVALLGWRIFGPMIHG